MSTAPSPTGHCSNMCSPTKQRCERVCRKTHPPSTLCSANLDMHKFEIASVTRNLFREKTIANWPNTHLTNCQLCRVLSSVKSFTVNMLKMTILKLALDNCVLF